MYKMLDTVEDTNEVTPEELAALESAGVRLAVLDEKRDKETNQLLLATVTLYLQKGAEVELPGRIGANLERLELASS